ncbi:unnamed protein product [Zymoseptoria tritici ST99CH_1A5]|uniref:Pathogen-related protein n=1 Tax=Zymoseptoria tritici ST99CH_1A5 TaxID=1276529 RepID=A0A1Y6LFR8_ZYMTR|nr:unnamed protein product [Zymoseptoria tritici ST99CH_1A5]
MTAEDPQQTTANTETAEETPALPDYLASPNAVFADEGVQWRYGRAPDYTKTRKVWAEGKRMNHAAGSLPQLVENLVKNWEVEASFKPRLSDWRTVDHEKYSFAMGSGEPRDAEHMIKVGTYNGIIGANEYYSPENSDFNSSHKTFKRMMPTFAWEVLEVYSGPPRVAFRWRHWGVMKSDYVGFNNKGEKVTAKAHGGLIDIEGVTIAEVDDKIRMQAIRTYMDPLEMFRQIAPEGVVRKETMKRDVDPDIALGDGLGSDEKNDVREHDSPSGTQLDNASDTTVKPETADEGPLSGQISGSDHTLASHAQDDHGAASTTPTEAPTDADPNPPSTAAPAAEAIISAAASQPKEMPIAHPSSNAKEVTQTLPPAGIPSSTASTPRDPLPSNTSHDDQNAARDHIDVYLEQPAERIHPEGHEVLPAGKALAAPADGIETRIAHEEMSRMSGAECPFLQNRE